jgi:hypothetical protein
MSITYFKVLGRRYYLPKEIDLEARHWGLVPVILAIQKSEIRRITVQSQAGQIDCISKNKKT